MLLRMIGSISKWNALGKINRPDAGICGDAISDLRTKENKLSVWKADSQKDIDDAAVALALNRDNIQKLSYVLLDEKELSKMEIEISYVNIPGDVACIKDKDLLKKHRDLIDIDYWRLGFLAEYMQKLVIKNINVKTFTVNDIKNLLFNYKKNDIIDTEKVKNSLKEQLNW